MNNVQKSKFTFSPLIVTTLIIVIDQLSKYLITIFIPVASYADIKEASGDFLSIIHVRNTSSVFNVLVESKSYFHIIMLFIISTIGFPYMLYQSILIQPRAFRNFFFAAIVGGGIGNIIDIFLRPDGVVDFINLNVYGLFGMIRWTFNIADVAINSAYLWFTFEFLILIKK